MEADPSDPARDSRVATNLGCPGKLMRRFCWFSHPQEKRQVFPVDPHKPEVFEISGAQKEVVERSGEVLLNLDLPNAKRAAGEF